MPSHTEYRRPFPLLHLGGPQKPHPVSSVRRLPHTTPSDRGHPRGLTGPYSRWAGPQAPARRVCNQCSTIYISNQIRYNGVSMPTSRRSKISTKMAAKAAGVSPVTLLRWMRDAKIRAPEPILVCCRHEAVGRARHRAHPGVEGEAFLQRAGAEEAGEEGGLK